MKSLQEFIKENRLKVRIKQETEHKEYDFISRIFIGDFEFSTFHEKDSKETDLDKYCKWESTQYKKALEKQQQIYDNVCSSKFKTFLVLILTIWDKLLKKLSNGKTHHTRNNSHINRK